MHELISKVCEEKDLGRNEGRRGVENLCKLVRILGYKDSMHFGQFAHDGAIGDLVEFLEDNSGCVEAIKEWIAEQNVSEWKENLQSELPEEICEECGEPYETYMKDMDGTNLEEVYGCPSCDG